MQIYFGENLKKLRRERDLTQEDLARCLNVAFQTVSKWERGETTPDIETLPAVARYFGVTTDALLGIDKIDENERIAEVRKLISAKSLAGDMDAVTELRRELARDFPRNDKVQLDLAMHLMGLFHGDRTRNNLDAIEIFERILDRSTDGEVRNTAESNLCAAYSNAGDKAKAVELAKKLPSAMQAREYTLIVCMSDLLGSGNVADDDESVRTLRESIFMFAAVMTTALAILMRVDTQRGGADTEQYSKMLQNVQEISAFASPMLINPALTDMVTDIVTDMVPTDGDVQTSAISGDSMVGLYAKMFSADGMGMIENMSQYFNMETVEAMNTGDTEIAGAVWGRMAVDMAAMYVSVDPEQAFAMLDALPSMFDGEHAHVDDVIIEKLAGPDFDPIRDDPRFVAAMEKLNASN
ncbi:MAG: helix-turn-helix domain-containing protein [Oscillospiraceae bacterium]|jgi:transcriptional regulator with XRE-family HTH domain|nr:helix-turn-helix domain-containing protein [Oscillospiraceae bacterium]